MIPQKKHLVAHYKLNGAKENGKELIENQTFEIDTWWSKDPGVTISEGKCKFNVGVGAVYKTNVLTIGKQYLLKFDITDYTSGGVKIEAAGTITRNGIGSYSEVFTADITSVSIKSMTGAVLSIDNVSCVEINKVLDFSGNGNHGTIIGTEAYEDDQFGKKAQDFNGTTSYIDCGTTDLIGTGDITVSMNIRFDSFGGGSYGRIFDNGSFEIYGNVSNNKIECRSDGSTGAGTNNNAIILGEFFNLCIVRKSNGAVSFYKNGINITNTSNSGTPAVATGNALIGNILELNRAFNGLMNNFMIFNTTLSPTEVKQLYQETSMPHMDSPTIVGSLTSDGVNDYVNTGIAPNQSTDIELKFKLNSFPTTADLMIFGAANSSVFDSPRFYFLVESDDDTFKFRFGSSNYDTGITASLSKVYTVKIQNKKVYLDGVFLYDFVAEPDWSLIYNLSLFAVNAGGTISRNVHATLYNCKIWQSGVLVRDFVPQLNGTFIDGVNRVVYSNSGTGTLTYKQEALETEDGLIFSTKDGVKDLTGKNDLINVNAIVGKEIVCDGTDRYIQTATGINANSLAGYTWITQVKINSFATQQFILDHRTSDVGYQPFYIGTGVSSGKLQFYSSVDADSSYFNTNLEVNKMYHLAMVIENNLVKCYVNGVFIASKSVTMSNFDTKLITIGARHKQTAGNLSPFNGTIYDVKVFNKALSPEQIKLKYNKAVRNW